MDKTKKKSRPSELRLFIYLSTLLHGDIDQTLVNSFHSLLNCEIGGLDSRVKYHNRVYISCHLNTHILAIL